MITSYCQLLEDFGPDRTQEPTPPQDVIIDDSYDTEDDAYWDWRQEVFTDLHDWLNRFGDDIDDMRGVSK